LAKPICGEHLPSMHEKRLPKHIGFIPDGNRRWAEARELPKEAGYQHGIKPGLALYEACEKLGIEEVSVYGFTQDNTHRPSVQARQFRAACVAFAREIAHRGAALAVVGDAESSQFPPELAQFTRRQGSGIKVNFLVNYGWQWDLNGLRESGTLRSSEVSRIRRVGSGSRRCR
jgi:undecaprenyl diphosphate synthase